jgi:23S rRNA (cytidine1920-2'-O)/16S rRNA (cytidine1409-2'-O)-methyltransferase
MKQRLDQALVDRKLAPTRSQAESFIKLGLVTVDGVAETKAGTMVYTDTELKLTIQDRYVSRAALKLSSVAKALNLDFRGKTMLDVGSSTGGFTDYALQHGATKVIAVDVGTDQLHPSLRTNDKIELHEQTDIRNLHKLSAKPDMVVLDVSFISLREILPHVAKLAGSQAQVVAMVKPQFEAGQSSLKHKGVIKNDKMRREIFKDFEQWAKQYFKLVDKADSEVSGSKGNQERFYLLKPLG